MSDHQTSQNIRLHCLSQINLFVWVLLLLFFRRMDASLAFKKLQPEDFYKAHIDQGVRPDGRGSLTASRPVSISVGSIGTADGSAIVKQVSTHYSHVTNRWRDSKKNNMAKKSITLNDFFMSAKQVVSTKTESAKPVVVFQYSCNLCIKLRTISIIRGHPLYRAKRVWYAGWSLSWPSLAQRPLKRASWSPTSNYLLFATHNSNLDHHPNWLRQYQTFSWR